MTKHIVIKTDNTREKPLPVIFRRWRYGNEHVVALFPTIAADRLGYLCESYMRVGQHGAADPTAITSFTKPASLDDKDVQELIKELQGVGYTHLVVIKRHSQQHLEERQKQFVEIF